MDCNKQCACLDRWQITADLQLFDILSVDDLALLHNSDRSLDDILELTPHNSLGKCPTDGSFHHLIASWRPSADFWHNHCHDVCMLHGNTRAGCDEPLTGICQRCLCREGFAG
jgi:hypothetical protein